MKIGDSRPVKQVQRYTDRAKVGSADAPSSERAISNNADFLGISANELTPKVRDAIMQFMVEVENLRQELQQSQSRIEYLERLVDQDSLAPVANRRAFVRELTRVMSFSERYNTPASVIYIDVNGMKTINDTHGHSTGNSALMRVADVLIENVHESDVVGRLGGDKFAIIPS